MGVDPSWYLGLNELTYLNSLKMKLSVILGVAQMALGIFMKALNAKQERKTVDFVFEFIPQIVLLLALFGFMDFMIITKWLTDYSAMVGAKPPSIISSMIIMSLSFGVQPPGKIETPFIANQELVMQTLMIIAAVSVPLMLFVKPIIEYRKEQSHHNHVEPADDNNYAINHRDSEY